MAIGSSLGSLPIVSSAVGLGAALPASVRPAVPVASYVWTNVSANQSAAPSPRYGSQAAYSPVLGKVVLFGGYDASVNPDGDTWAFVAEHWQRSTPTISPPPRWSGMMVYDALDGYLLMFGGRNDTQYFNDTWEYNASGWHRMITAMAPSPRSNPGLAFDPTAGEVILYGGGRGNVPVGSGSPWVFYNDTWAYRAGVWANITHSAGAPPSARGTKGMIYDGADGYILLEGGGNGNPPCPTWYGDSWGFSGGRWIPIRTVSAPPPSDYGGVLYSAATRGTLLYQGASYTPSCVTYSSQVWTYSTYHWNLSVPASSGSPPGRGGAMWVDDPTDRVEVLFDGSGASRYLNDTWLLRANLALDPGVSSDRPSADVGQTAVFSVGTFFGGWPPYSYAWQGLPGGCVGAVTPTVHCTFLVPAALRLSFVLTDSHGGQVASNPFPYAVFSDPVFASNPSAYPNPVSVGSPVTFSENVAGGSGGFTFHWRGLPSGCPSIDASVLTCTPSRPGTFSLSLTANDSNGENATSPVWSAQVVQAPGSPTTGGTFGTFLGSPWFLGGAAAILVGAVLSAWYRARKTRPRLLVSLPEIPRPPPPPN